MKIKESKLRKIISEEIVNQVLLSLEDKVEGVVDYLYNEGVVAYDDDHLSAMANDMSLIDFKDICKTIISEYGSTLTGAEREMLDRYLLSGSFPELENHIYNAIKKYEQKAHEYLYESKLREFARRALLNEMDANLLDSHVNVEEGDGYVHISFGKNGWGLTDEFLQIHEIVSKLSKSNNIYLEKCNIDALDDVYDFYFRYSNENFDK